MDLKLINTWSQSTEGNSSTSTWIYCQSQNHLQIEHHASQRTTFRRRERRQHHHVWLWLNEHSQTNLELFNVESPPFGQPIDCILVRGQWWCESNRMFDTHRREASIGTYQSFRKDLKAGGRRNQLHRCECYGNSERLIGAVVQAARYFLQWAAVSATSFLEFGLRSFWFM